MFTEAMGAASSSSLSGFDWESRLINPGAEEKKENQKLGIIDRYWDNKGKAVKYKK